MHQTASAGPSATPVGVSAAPSPPLWNPKVVAGPWRAAHPCGREPSLGENYRIPPNSATRTDAYCAPGQRGCPQRGSLSRDRGDRQVCMRWHGLWEPEEGEMCPKWLPRGSDI